MATRWLAVGITTALTAWLANGCSLASGDDDLKRSRYVEIPGATFVDDDPPTPSESKSRPAVGEVEAPSAVLNGGSSSFRVFYSDPDGDDTVREVLIVIDGDSGYFTLPATIGEDGEIVVTIDDELTEQLLKFGFAVVDDDGNVSDYKRVTTDVVPSGSGDIKIVLSWNIDTDLDLHVKEPGGFEVFFGEPISPAGGELDVDSNADCTIDGIDNENVFWPKGAAPNGEYVVSVEHYASCLEDTARFVVTVLRDGRSETFRGELNPGDVGEPVEVTRFTH